MLSPYMCTYIHICLHKSIPILYIDSSSKHSEKKYFLQWNLLFSSSRPCFLLFWYVYRNQWLCVLKQQISGSLTWSTDSGDLRNDPRMTVLQHGLFWWNPNRQACGWITRIWTISQVILRCRQSGQSLLSTRSFKREWARKLCEGSVSGSEWGLRFCISNDLPGLLVLLVDLPPPPSPPLQVGKCSRTYLSAWLTSHLTWGKGWYTSQAALHGRTVVGGSEPGQHWETVFFFKSTVDSNLPILEIE